MKKTLLLASMLIGISALANITNVDYSLKNIKDHEKSITSNVEEFVKSTKDYKNYAAKFQKESNNLDWSTAVKYEENGMWAVSVSDFSKSKNLIISSVGKSFLQDLSFLNERKIVNYSINSSKEYTIMFDKNNEYLAMYDESGEKVEEEALAKCGLEHGALCAGVGAISAPSGPGAVFVFGACMLLICD